MSDIREVIKRLEEATGPSRELDALLHPTEAWYDEDRDEWRAQYGDTSGTVEVPFYTASIDAALSLVPDGWQISVHTTAPSVPVGHSAALQAGSPPFYDDEREIDADEATPAIALCIAALKARFPEAQS